MAADEDPHNMQWHFAEAVAAWVLPGAGHFLIGERRRGAILCVLIMVLWLAGLLIGGICVIDHHDNLAWFVPQSLMAPTILADAGGQILRSQYHDDRGNIRPPVPQEHPAFEPSYGRINEQGILYTGLAGLLNLLAIIDVLYHDPNRRASERMKKSGGNPVGTPTVTLPAFAFLLLPMLAYRPFLDPIDLHGQWLWLLPPLTLAVAMVYKTIKSDDLNQLAKQSLVLAAQIIAFMIVAAALLWFITELPV